MNMDTDFLRKRIAQTKQDIFPLDRLLPLETVYAIFAEHYAKEPNKSIFFHDRKYQRLREGYIGLFVAASLWDISGKPHFIVFPEKPDNDLYFAYQLNETQMGVYEFDVKEFTDHSPFFEDFVAKSIAPKIGVYNIVITTYRNVGEREAKCLIDLLQKENTSRQIWLLGAPTENDESPDVSRVSVIGKDGLAYDRVINLSDWLNKTRPITVFHDVLRLKYPPSSGT